MSFFGKPFDVLAIGDIATDVFIKIKEAHLNCKIDNTACEICMKFADKVPFESATEVKGVGNSANAAVSSARLGLSSAIIAHVGLDKEGDECMKAIEDNDVSTKFIHQHKDIKTNYHYVLWYGAERTILVNHAEFPYSFPFRELENDPPKWIYLSSLASNSLPYHAEIATFLQHHPTTKLCFQPGTFQMKIGKDKLANIYRASEVVIVNVEEAQRILGLPENGSENAEEIKSLVAGIAGLGPKIICVTNGPKGAYMRDSTGIYFMPIYPDPKPPIERTGCGDAFASTFISYLSLGKTPLEALRMAPINPMSVVQHIGAQEGLLSRVELEELLAKAPADFVPVKI